MFDDDDLERYSTIEDLRRVLGKAPELAGLIEGAQAARRDRLLRALARPVRGLSLSRSIPPDTHPPDGDRDRHHLPRRFAPRLPNLGRWKRSA